MLYLLPMHMHMPMLFIAYVDVKDIFRVILYSNKMKGLSYKSGHGTHVHSKEFKRTLDSSCAYYIVVIRW